MSPNLALIAIATGFTVAAFIVSEPTVSGPARAIDGDTIAIGSTRVRLWGIDAVERHQWCFIGQTPWACGEQARTHLSTATAGKIVTCTILSHDRYGRLVGQCTTAKGDLAENQVRAGWAVDWPLYDREHRYKPVEEDAVRNGRGIWAGDFVLPWIWRKNNNTYRQE